jgi:hypothetical protein
MEIEEHPDGLVIRTVRKGSVLYALLAAAVAGALVFLIGLIYFHRPALLVLTVLAATWGSSRWWRTVRVELRITQFEMLVTGHLRSVPDLNPRIPMANIRRLEYRAGQGKVGPEQFGGLYAVQRWKADCVLPRLDEKQTQQAIDAIYRRFPFIPVSPERDVPGRDLVTLDLNSPRKADATTHS